MNSTKYCLLIIIYYCQIFDTGKSTDVLLLSTDAPIADDQPYVNLSHGFEEITTSGSPILLEQSSTNSQSQETDNKNSSNSDIPAGIYFRISQKGMDYITSLTAEALPQLFEKSEIPTIEHPQIKILQLIIDKFGNPTIKAKFLADTGIGAYVFLPHVMLNAIFDASTFISTHKGKLKAEVKNLSVIMEVHISRNESARLNIIETPVCNVTADHVRIVFAGEMSTYLNLLRSVIEQTVIDVLGNELCQLPLKVAQFFEHQKQQILMTTPVPQTTPSTPTPTYLLKFGELPERANAKSLQIIENENAFYETSDEKVDDDEDLAAKFAAELCADDRIDMDTLSYSKDVYLRRRRELYFRETPESERFNPLLKDGFWAPDLTLLYPPKFSNEDVIFGLDAGIIFYGRRAKNVNRPDMLNISSFGEKMFGSIISEYVPNTFFAHVYDENMGVLRETFRTRNLPKFIKPIAKLICASCELQFIANLTRRPYLSINEQGVKIDIELDLIILFVGKKQQRNIVNANVELDVTVRPYLRHSNIYGDVALTGVDIKMKGVFGGTFANAVRRALNTVVPKKLWPKIKKRLRFAFNQRGIRLPVTCGVELERPSLSYIDHGIVIDTDFSYDLPRFVRKFKLYLNAEIARAKKKEQIGSDEDY